MVLDNVSLAGVVGQPCGSPYSSVIGIVSSTQVQPSRHLKSLDRRVPVTIVTVVAGLAATSANTAPTGNAVWDLVLTITFVMVVTLAGSAAPRWVVVVFCVLAAGAGGFGGWGLLGWLALLIAAASVGFVRRQRLTAAVSTGIAIQTLLRLSPIGFFGLPSLLVGLASMLVLLAGYRNSRQATRRIVRLSLFALGLTSTVILGFGVVSVFDARADANVGVAAARRSIDAARAGNADEASNELVLAEKFLLSARSTLNAPATRALGLFPVLAQHHEAFMAATSVGAQVSNQASVMVGDLEAINASLTSGSVDLDALTSLAPRLQQTVLSLEDAQETIGQLDSPWLTSAVRTQVQNLSDEIASLLPELQTASSASAVLPAMLGSENAQHYLVFFGTPAEAREFGGFVGSWALISLDQGRIELIDSGRKADLYPTARASTIDPATTTDWFMEMARPTQFPENLTSSPDFRFVADMTQQVLGGITDRPLAGLIYMDAVALIDMLELTGPVSVPFRTEPLSSNNAERFFFRDQYEFVLDDRDELFGDLATVAETVLDRLTSTALPGPEELGRVLGPAARGGHLQIITFNEQQNAFLRSVQLLRDFRFRHTTDFVALVHSNGLSNKLDLYLDRTLEYKVVEDEDGGLTAAAVVTLRSSPPPDAPPLMIGLGETAGTNRLELSLYTPHSVDRILRNGEPVDFKRAAEFGLRRLLVEVEVPGDGSTVVLEYSLRGQQPPNEPYSLEVWNQPLINSDSVSVSYTAPDGAINWTGKLDEHRTFIETSISDE